MSQEHSVNASALVVASHLHWHCKGFPWKDVDIIFILRGCPQQQKHVEGGQVAALSVGKEDFGLILMSMLPLVSLEIPTSPLAASSGLYSLKNGLSENLFFWSCVHLCVNVVDVRFFSVISKRTSAQ